MQSSELQNLKWEYKFNSARHLQQMTGAGFTFTPTLITKVHPRNTGCVAHPRSEYTTQTRGIYILKNQDPYFTITDTSIQPFSSNPTIQRKRKEKKIEVVEEGKR